MHKSALPVPLRKSGDHGGASGAVRVTRHRCAHNEISGFGQRRGPFVAPFMWRLLVATIIATLLAFCSEVVGGQFHLWGGAT
jgi:hypothetical protein